MSQTKRRIENKGFTQLEQADAGAAGIYPGMLLEVNSDGDVVAHASEAGYAERLFALEDALQGNTVDDVYTSGEVVQVLMPVQGTTVNALCAGGYTYAIGTELVSDGLGKLMPITELASPDTAEDVVAICQEAAVLEGSADADTLLAVRVR